MGFKPHELDALEQGDPRDFLTFISILSILRLGSFPYDRRCV